MGYCMHSVDCQFEIPTGPGADYALAAIRILGSDGHSWIDRVDTSDLGRAFDSWRWQVELNGDGSAWILHNFEGEKAGSDMALFEAVAPFVKPGSYIEMCGDEDGASWRWVFDGISVKEKYPEVTW